MFNKFLIIILIISFFGPQAMALAAEGNVKSQNTAPTNEVVERFKDWDKNFIGFLEWLFPVMLAVATILAVLTLIFAGFKWMAGAISPPAVEEAKKMIWAAVGGLALALSSWLILNTINPQLIPLTQPALKTTTLKIPESPETKAETVENLTGCFTDLDRFRPPFISMQKKCYEKGGGFFMPQTRPLSESQCKSDEKFYMCLKRTNQQPSL